MDNQQSATPKFAHLQYEVIHKLDITITEYFYLDMVYFLSRNGWCYKSLDNIAYDMKLTKNGILKMRKRLLEKDLLIKGKANRVKTSEKYNSVYFLDTPVTKKVNLVSSKSKLSIQKSKLSIPKNNKELHIEKKLNKENSETQSSYDPNASGYLKAKAIADRLRGRQSLINEVDKRLSS